MTQKKQTGNRFHERVRTAKGRKRSSTLWLQRQLNDPYVREAQKHGFRARAAYKLIEMDDRFRFLKKGARVIDLGAAPGSWTQVAVARTKSTRARAHVWALDILPMDSLAGAYSIEMDFMADDAITEIETIVNGKVDVVLSDMAAPATGHKKTDHLRTMALAEAAADFALQILAPNGVFIAKLFQGGAEKELLDNLKREFTSVQHVKPKASRKESVELYVVARGKK